MYVKHSETKWQLNRMGLTVECEINIIDTVRKEEIRGRYDIWIVQDV